MLPVASNTVEKIAAGEVAQALGRVGVSRQAFTQTEDIAAEGQPVGARVEEGDLRPARLGEQGSRDADRSGADDQRALAAADLGTLGGVGADRQELDQRRLVQRQAIGREH